jgi:hypothetical protein
MIAARTTRRDLKDCFMSAIPPTADVAARVANGREVPEADFMQAANIVGDSEQHGR